MRNPIAFLGLVLGAACVLDSMTNVADAAERQGRLTLEVRVKGREAWRRDATNFYRTEFADRYYGSVMVSSDGELRDYNPLASDYATQMAGRSANVARAVVAAGAVSPAAPASPQEMQARMQQAYAACGGNTQCLLEVGKRVSEWTIQSVAASTSNGPNQDGQYLEFIGQPGCKSDFRMVHEASGSGSYEELAGPIAYSFTARGEDSSGGTKGNIDCRAQHVVLDAKRNALQMISLPIPDGAITRTTTSQGKTNTLTERRSLPPEVHEWIASELISQQPRVARSGKRRATLPMTRPSNLDKPGHTYEGTLEAEFTWTFEER